MRWRRAEALLPDAPEVARIGKATSGRYRFQWKSRIMHKMSSQFEPQELLIGMRRNTSGGLEGTGQRAYAGLTHVGKLIQGGWLADMLGQPILNLMYAWIEMRTVFEVHAYLALHAAAAQIHYKVTGNVGCQARSTILF